MSKFFKILIILLIVVGISVAGYVALNNNHQHELTEVAEVAATCTEAGTKAYYKCSGCDKLFADAEGANEIAAPEVIKELGHSFTNYASDDNATCTADGTKTAKCDRCEETDTLAEAGSKLNHTYNQEVTTLNGALKSAADCTKAAVYYKSCSCGAISDTETFEDGTSLGHDYTEKVVDEAHLKANGADCQTKDTYWYDCTRCASISDELYFDGENAGEHNVSTEWTTADGKHFHECTVSGCDYTEGEKACSDVLTDNDHKCEVCEAPDVTSHAYGDWEKVDENNHKKTCNCGDAVTEAHNWDDGVVTTNPTHTSNGVKTYTCDACKDTKTDEISAITDHIYNQENTELDNVLKSDADCENAAVYYKSCVCGEISNTETFTIGTSLGHTYGEASYVWSDDNATCTATRVCERDESHKETETVNADVDTTNATCTEDGKIVYTATFAGEALAKQTKEVNGDSATGHSYGEWALVTSPTYDVEGVLSGTCTTCSGTEEKNIGVISAEGGYTLVISGVLSRWQFTIDDQTFTFDIAEIVDTTDGKNTYSATNGTPWYVGKDASGSLVKLDGYKTTDATWDGTNLSFGGNGMTYYTTVTSPKATTVTLIINCARNKAKPFFADSATEHCIDNLAVNGSADNVICKLDAQIAGGDWHAYTDYVIATLFLKEGDNIISFKTATTVNVKGIGFISTEAIHMHTDVIDEAVEGNCVTTGYSKGLHCSDPDCNAVIIAQEEYAPSGEHTWSDKYSIKTAPNYVSEGQLAKKCSNCDVYNEETKVTLLAVSEANGYTKIASTATGDEWTYIYEGQTVNVTIPVVKYEFTVADNDPFAVANGGTFGSSNWHKDGYYENTANQTFTITINVAEATDAVFMIKIGRNGQTEKISDLFTYLKVNDTEMTESINTAEITGGSNWSAAQAKYATIATIHLNKGTNVITFTRGDTANDVANFNVFGVAFESTVPVELGTAEAEATE